MGKKGGTSKSEVSTDLPDFIKPYVTRMLDRAEGASQIPYYRYPGERLAALTPTTQHGLNMIRGLAGLTANPTSASPYVDIPYVDIPDEYKTAPKPVIKYVEVPAAPKGLGGLNGGVNDRGGQAGERDNSANDNEGARDNDRSTDGRDHQGWADGGIVTPSFPELDQASQVTSNVAGYTAPGVSTTTFDQADISGYMNPYVENVLNRLQDRTKDRYGQDLRDINARAVQAGAFGGDRAMLAGLQRQEDLFQELGDVEAEQMAGAYDRATGLYSEDQNRKLQADLANQGAGLSVAQLRLGAGGQLAGLQQLRQGLTLEQADALVGAGQVEQNQNQQAAQIAYEEFLRERGYEADQAAYLASLLGTVNYAPNSTTTQPGTNPLTSIAGLGLAAAGLFI